MGKEGLRLSCKGTIEDLNAKKIILHDGLKLTVWTNDKDEQGNIDNLTVSATIKYSYIDKCWVAQFQNDDLKHESDRL